MSQKVEIPNLFIVILVLDLLRFVCNSDCLESWDFISSPYVHYSIALFFLPPASLS